MTEHEKVRVRAYSVRERWGTGGSSTFRAITLGNARELGDGEPPLPPLSCRCKHPHPHKDTDGLTRCTRCGRRCLPQLTLTDEAA